MTDVKLLLERQARWQQTRRALTWPEKVRMAEQVREAVLLLRHSAKGEATSGQPPRTASHSGRPKRP